MKKSFLLISLILGVLIVASACGKKTTPALVDTTNTPMPSPTNTPSPLPTDTPTPTETPTNTPTETPTPTTHPKDLGLVQSKFSGLWISKEDAAKRPYAFMINNIEDAYPQRALSEASIIYECRVEWGITRMMAVFEAQKSTESVCSSIGSIRSARHYYVDLALDMDAIYVHFGGSSLAVDYIKQIGMADIDGINGSIGVGCFYRDNTIPSPHNVFLPLSTLRWELEHSSFRTNLRENYSAPFAFYEEDTQISGDSINKVLVSYSDYAHPEFVYNKDTGCFERYQFNELHVDASTGKPLEFKNVLILFAKETVAGDSDLQDIKFKGDSGPGYFLSNGVKVPILWDKNGEYMVVTDSLGKQLKLNPGATFVCVVPNTRTNYVIFQ